MDEPTARPSPAPATPPGPPASTKPPGFEGPPATAPGAPAGAAPAAATPTATPEVRLSRDLGMMDATMLGVGALMGGGVFVLLGIGAEQAGPGLLLAFLLNGLITIPTLTIYAELGSAFSDTGGGYLWIKAALKQPWGFLGGWVSWFSHAIACAVYSLASAFYLVWLLRFVRKAEDLPLGLPEHQFLVLVALAFAGLFILLNYFGVKVSIKTENAITYLVLIVVGVFLVFGIYGLYNGIDLATRNMVDFLPKGYSGVFLAMGITFIAFEGYEIISQTGEEIKNPRRTIPRAIWASLLIVWPILLLTALVAIGMTDVGYPSWQFLGEHRALALVEAARFVMPYGSLAILVSALLLQLVALNATIYSSSRVSFAMGRDQNLPKIFGAIHPTRRTPHWSVLVSGAIILLMAGTLPIETVAVAADVLFLMLFLLVNVAYIKLHHALPKERVGYRAPWFPVMPLLGIAAQGLLAVYLFKYSPTAWYIAAGIIVGGLVFYTVLVRPREEATTARLREHTVFAEAPGIQKDYRILVPLTNPATVRGLALAARDIAVGKEGEIVFLYVVTLPSATPLEAGTKFTAQGQPLLDEAMAAVGYDVPCSAIVRIGHDPSRTIRSTAQEKGISLVLVAWKGQRGTGVTSTRLDDLLENPPCDLAIVKVVNTPPPQRILQSSQGGAHAQLALQLTGAIAKARNASVKVLQVVTPSEESEATDAARQARARAMLAQTLPQNVHAEVEVAHTKLVVSEILKRGRGHDLLVVGATRQPFWRTTMFGNKPEQMAAGFPGSVLMVKTYEGKSVENVRSMFRFFKVFRRMLKPD